MWRGTVVLDYHVLNVFVHSTRVRVCFTRSPLYGMRLTAGT